MEILHAAFGTSKIVVFFIFFFFIEFIHKIFHYHVMQRVHSPGSKTKLKVNKLGWTFWLYSMYVPCGLEAKSNNGDVNDDVRAIN